jgi:hypothetical protein
MGLKKIVGVRQYTTFTPMGKVVKMYEVKFVTEKTEGEFTFDVPADEYTAARAVEMAQAQAKEIDAAMS